MAQKNNIRSIRFSDEMSELIDRRVGDTFTQKFENLITRCVWELPQKEKQLADIQAQINRELNRLYDLRRATEQLQMLEQDLKRAKQSFELVARRAKAIAEAAEQAGRARNTTRASSSMSGTSRPRAGR